MIKHAIVIHERDNVATCVQDIAAGTLISFFRGGNEETLWVHEDIPLGHKVALYPIATNQDILKYAESIGVATRNIAPGQHVHVHNLESKRGRGDLDSLKEE